VLGSVRHEQQLIDFKTTGTVIESLGWQLLYKSTPTEKEQKILPAFVKGEAGAHQPFITAGKTTAPKPYNEASLLSIMESAGKNLPMTRN